jgi:hypothetical protein
VNGRGETLAEASDYAHLPSTLPIGGDWLAWLTLTAPGHLELGPAWVELGIYRSPGVRPVAVTDSAGHDLGSQLRLGPVATRPTASGSAGAPAAPPLARFGESIELADARVSRPDSRSALVALRWRASVRAGADYQAFVHVVDATAGQLPK